MFFRLSTWASNKIVEQLTFLFQETYGSFHYTSLLYLSTYGEDFTGGRFTFVDRDANRTIEPRIGNKFYLNEIRWFKWK